MKKRILAIICIMFLLFTATTPLLGGVFSYADEPQQEQLSQDEVIKAAIALYLNERKAWITSTTSAPIDAVQAQMQIWIDSYEFWTEHTTIGSAAAFYAQCIVKYNPFRISLKGPAVRALNDLYNWLIDSGKLPNLDADNSGGETTDNLYNGLLNGDSLYYIVDKNTYQSNLDAQYFNVSPSNIVTGSPARGVTWQSIKSGFDAANNNNVDYTANSNPGYSNYTFSVQWAADKVRSYTVGFSYAGSASVNRPYSPKIGCNVSGTDIDNISGTYFLAGSIYINNGTKKVYGNPAFIQIKNNSGVITTYIGIVSYNATSNNYIVQTYEKFGSETSTPANVNLDTDNFNKTDPTPPEGDEEVTYTPSDKTTGDTYNTYNEYITNYVTKNTVVNNNNSGGGGSDPSPGGTTPPWDDGTTTVNPDGGGGYDVSLPDLTLPDLDIDWSINGLKDKFPFSIPWDLMAFFTVLNAEPETPSIQADIDLGIVDWEIDWDFHNFDTLAALLRNLEFIGFCLALLLITRSIIKG